MLELKRIADELSRLAQILQELSQQPPSPSPSVQPLVNTAPSELEPVVRQTVGALARLLPGDGARVFLAGIHRHQGRTTSWYQYSTEEDARKALDNLQKLRSLSLLAQPERLRLLFAFVQGAKGTAEAMEKSGLTQGQFYHHLRALEAAGLVRKLGRDSYAPTISGVSSLFTLLALVDYLGTEGSEGEEP